MRITKFILTGAALLLLAGCGSSGGSSSNQQQQPNTDNSRPVSGTVARVSETVNGGYTTICLTLQNERDIYCSRSSYQDSEKVSLARTGDQVQMTVAGQNGTYDILSFSFAEMAQS